MKRAKYCTCGGKSVCFNSREHVLGYCWRRRRCLSCGAKWTTLEGRVSERQMRVIARDLRDQVLTTTPSGAAA